MIKYLGKFQTSLMHPSFKWSEYSIFITKCLFSYICTTNKTILLILVVGINVVSKHKMNLNYSDMYHMTKTIVIYISACKTSMSPPFDQYPLTNQIHKYNRWRFPPAPQWNPWWRNERFGCAGWDTEWWVHGKIEDDTLLSLGHPQQSL